VLALLAAAGVVLLTQDAIWYPVVFLGGQVLALAHLLRRLGVVSLSRETWAAAVSVLREQRAAAASDVVFAVILAAPTSILAAVAPGSVATFAAGERVQRLAQSGIQPLFNAFQGWVSETSPAGRAARMRLALAATTACGVAGGTTCAVGLPLVDDQLFAGEVAVGSGVSSFLGLSLALYALTSSITFTVLAPAGHTRTILRATALSGGVLVLGAGLLPQVWGATGAAAAVATAQVAALLVQVPAGRRVLHGHARAEGLPADVAAPPR